MRCNVRSWCMQPIGAKSGAKGCIEARRELRLEGNAGSAVRLDQRRHAAGEAVFAAMGEEFLAMGERAAIRCINPSGRDAGVDELKADGLAQIDMAFAIVATTAWGAIAEDAIKFGEHFRADFERRRTDARPDCGNAARCARFPVFASRRLRRPRPRRAIRRGSRRHACRRHWRPGSARSRRRERR